MVSVAKRKRWKWLENLAYTHGEGSVLYLHASPIDPIMDYVKESDVEDLGLGGFTCLPATVRYQGGVVTHLFEAGEESKDVHVWDLVSLVTEHFDDFGRVLSVDREIEGFLGRKEVAVAQVLHLVREVGQHLVFDPTKSQRSETLAEDVELMV